MNNTAKKDLIDALEAKDYEMIVTNLCSNLTEKEFTELFEEMKLVYGSLIEWEMEEKYKEQKNGKACSSKERG